MTTIRLAPLLADQLKWVRSSSSDQRAGADSSAEIDEREKQNGQLHWQAIRTGSTEQVRKEQSAQLIVASRW
ncbi:hypothetical protein PJK45_01320 [Mycobacterium kansasii]|uniref:Uncharacterized protein n=2 Tax=Mycobacterium kansasii TaxID=1768 RepID=A0A7G1IM06_MYCKA|nr:hypothetical protein [Mycobacterium kansasii]AGZ54359.1 hypothetical protein MKAN_20715 [Mycobacterium kansasii ATCC 12478]KZS78601.1 hypothetical protein A4G30_19375 [Mycobacterium kansasii]UCA22837.1 hypothetical protein LA359_17835 [Mycobacterium kansasii]UGT84217.1 hypothetical protein LTS70_09880 [Mycobacterium kansasii]UGT89541.1 hypothetical protein LTT71_03275 [Mycobacterium kansasii]